MDELAINGGPKTKTTPYGTGKRFGEEEKKLLMEVIDSDMLFYVFGTKVKDMEKKISGIYGLKYANGCSSGTAAVHIALGSLFLEPGKEVITSSCTDMGSITGILYQQLIPQFADIDPETYNMDPASVEKLINKKTGAILVVHHAGLPADMDQLIAIAKKYNIPIVEDCAQAWITKYKGKFVGTFGEISTFSLNHFKHITCGSGGVVMTNRDDLEARIKLFIDKCYDRTPGAKRNPYFLAPNYQMTELQGAIAIAQLDKVQKIVDRRIYLGTRLVEGLKKIAGIIPQKIPEGSIHTFFLFVIRVDPEIIPIDINDFCKAIQAEGVNCEPKKITGGMPTYLYDIFQKKQAFIGSLIPFESKELGSNTSYPKGMCPNCEEAFEHTFNFSITEFYSEKDIDEMIAATTKVAAFYRKK